MVVHGVLSTKSKFRMTLQHSTIHYGTKNDKKPQKLIRYYRGIPRYGHYLFFACTEPHQPGSDNHE